MLAGLGAVASAARAAGLGRPLDVVRDGCDRAFLALGQPPLRGRIEGLAFRGYLRHRTFLPVVHGFIQTIRDARPETPITVISPIISPDREDSPVSITALDARLS